MHVRTLRDLDDQRGESVRQGQTLRCEVERGIDAVGAGFADKGLDRVELWASELSCLAAIGHAEDENPAHGVSECGQFVGHCLPGGRTNPTLPEEGLLELHTAVLAQLDLTKHSLRGPHHANGFRALSSEDPVRLTVHAGGLPMPSAPQMDSSGLCGESETHWAKPRSSSATFRSGIPPTRAATHAG